MLSNSPDAASTTSTQTIVYVFSYVHAKVWYLAFFFFSFSPHVSCFPVLQSFNPRTYMLIISPLPSSYVVTPRPTMMHPVKLPCVFRLLASCASWLVLCERSRRVFNVVRPITSFTPFSNYAISEL